MHWKEFQEKAVKLHPKFYFKRTLDGYEVWDVAQISGPGMPRKYKCMVIPYGTNSVGFSMMYKKLVRGNWNRRMALQHKLTLQSMENNTNYKKYLSEEREKKILERAREMRPVFKRVAQQLGINSRTMLNKANGMSWDDAKRKLRQTLEARGAWK